MMFACACLLSGGAQSQDAGKEGDSAPVYKPPMRGAPASRIGGGSRGIGTALPHLYVLAPQDVGFTTEAKPDLFWFASDPSDARVKLKIYTDDPDKPLLEQTLPAVSAAGVQRTKLSGFGLELEPRVEYHWRISLYAESPGHTGRAIAGGTIQRTSSWPKLEARLQNHPALERVRVYAEEGLWYDAIEQISNAIDGDPGNAAIRKQRAALLGQVGLSEASQFELAKR